MIKQVQASYNPAQLEKAVREFLRTKTNAYKKTKRGIGLAVLTITSSTVRPTPLVISTWVRPGTRPSRIPLSGSSGCSGSTSPTHPAMTCMDWPIEVKVNGPLGSRTRKRSRSTASMVRRNLQGVRPGLPEEDERAVRGTGHLDGLGEPVSHHQFKLHRGGLVDSLKGLTTKACWSPRTVCFPDVPVAKRRWPRRRSSIRTKKDPYLCQVPTEER